MGLDVMDFFVPLLFRICTWTSFFGFSIRTPYLYTDYFIPVVIRFSQKTS